MGIRTLLLLLAIAGVVWIAGRLMRQRAAPRAETRKPLNPMVRCARCGLHVPKYEALEGTGGWYCSRAHRELGPDDDRRDT